MAASTEQSSYKDSGYAWVILICAFCMRLIDSSAFVTMGLFIIEYLEYFNLDRALMVTAFISFFYIAMAFAGPIGGIAIRRYGVRPIVATGISVASIMLLIAGTFPSIWVLGFCYFFMGWGFQMSGVGSMVIVQQYFEKRRSFASGIVMSGLSCSTFLWPPLLRFLIDMYTWRGALYILAGVAVQSFVFICLLRPPPKVETKGRNAMEKDKVDAGTKTLKYFIWALYIVSLTAQFMGHFTPINYFPMKGHQDGIEKHKVPMLVSVIGGMGIFGRPLAGLISDRFVNRITLAIIFLFICGISLIVSAFLHTFPSLITLGVFHGIFQSFYIGTLSAQWVDVFGLENIAIGSGLGGFSSGFSVAILHPIAEGCFVQIQLCLPGWNQ